VETIPLTSPLQLLKGARPPRLSRNRRPCMWSFDNSFYHNWTRYYEEWRGTITSVRIPLVFNFNLRLIQVTVGTGCGRWARMTSLQPRWSSSHWTWRNIRSSLWLCSASTISRSSTNWTQSLTSKLCTVRTIWTALSGYGHLQPIPLSVRKSVNEHA